MIELSQGKILVIGAGIMGTGIAQVAAQTGHQVALFDAKEGANLKAIESLTKSLENLVSRGKMSPELMQTTLQNIRPIQELSDAKDVVLVIEAIVEKLDVKRALFQQLETVVSEQCILATNTSSISVTAIANGLKRPQQLVGMHFFNPVPVMKLVEVVSGLQTDPEVANAIFTLSQAWSKVPVHTKSTPGFIVNRIARPFYAEALGMLQEQVASPFEIDSCLKSAGFKMGPCELMDLIGHDTNFSVTSSVYEANFYDKRFTPSLIQKELVDGGLLGRKSGRGFYDYSADAVKPSILTPEAKPLPSKLKIVLHGDQPLITFFSEQLESLNIKYEFDEESDWSGVAYNQIEIRITDGLMATEMDHNAVLIDQSFAPFAGMHLAWTHSTTATKELMKSVENFLITLGIQPIKVIDSPGLIVARTIAMLINEACDAVNQAVCTEDAVNQAMRLGVNYPQGPFDWLEQWSAADVAFLLDSMDDFYRGERYRVSPMLRRKSCEELLNE
ncbi:3-hydroxyacyl-CoA dehydrogenase [Polynucleobacter kasalickyi]|uniref:3-hydroxyacyl-CoA dehydrogenase n=1 Tax=Polynucleobacter kasalickyi TaxID=1938817 RepID=A0A1W1ZGQ3_9BURK|nr:3-hydroxyacyl-CoA dehydrogenase [Polynucleobacter kasalickyi]SMC47659.1 3-hydroxyacyl-CoA dehydrogenase [Polynucleobacter kasalickyi]